MKDSSLKDLGLVLALIEGKHFVADNESRSSSIIIEAKFNGCTLYTDPKRMRNKISFNTELIWETDRQTFYILKLNKSPIKINVFKISKEGIRELIGYFVMDLRPCVNLQESKMTIKWHRLLGTKHFKGKPYPEISVGLGYRLKTTENGLLGSNTEIKCNEVTNIVPVLNEDLGYFVIGLETCENSIYELTVTISAAQSLSCLILDVPEEPQYYCFYYTIMGCDIFTDEFQNASLPDFSIEITSVKISSTSEYLKQYFISNPLEIYLLQNLQKLAKCEINLCGIMSVEAEDKMSPKFLLGGDFLLLPLSNQYDMDNDMQALLSVNIELNLMNHPENLDNAQLSAIELRPCPSRKLSGGGVKSSGSIGIKSSGSFGLKSSVSNSSIFVEPKIKTKPIKMEQNNPKCPYFNNMSCDTRMYTLMLDIHSLKVNLPLSKAVIGIDYYYPLFGVTSKVTMNLFVGNTGSLQVVPNGIQNHKFSCQADDLYDCFSFHPILFHIGIKEKNALYSKAKSLLSLESLLTQPNTIININDNIYKRIKDKISCPITCSSTDAEIGQINIIVQVDDLGPASGSNQYFTADDPCQVGKDLELWKNEQQVAFTKKLKEQSDEYIEKLTADWMKLETAREAEFSEIVKTYENMKVKLSKSLAKIEAKNNEMKNLKIEYDREKGSLLQKHEVQRKELNDARTTIQDLRQKMKKSQTSLETLKASIDGYKNDIANLEKKLHQKQQEIEKTSILVKCEKEKDVYKLKFERDEYAKKYEKAKASKASLKEQLDVCQKNFEKYRAAVQENEKAILFKEREAIEKIRLECLAREATCAIRSDTAYLSRMQRELDTLSEEFQVDEPGKPVTKLSSQIIENDEEFLNKLIHQRSILLNICKDPDKDTVIQEINRKISMLENKLDKL